MNNRTLVLIPTYNEKENVEKIYYDINSLGLNLDILFIDDNSPDGTGSFLDSLSMNYPNIKVIHRRNKLGVGSAHLYGIKWAYLNQYSTLITMDADYSHNPGSIINLLANKNECDVIVGSRFIKKGSLPGWSISRKIWTNCVHIVLQISLNLRYDATNAFRLYRLDRIPLKLFTLVHSDSYPFFFESLFILYLNKFTIKDIPIILPARTYGHSKMKFKDIAKALFTLIRVFFLSKFNSRALLIN